MRRTRACRRRQRGRRASPRYRHEILAGLTAPQKRLAPKYLYDRTRLGIVRRDLLAARVLRDANGGRAAARLRDRTIAAIVGPRADVVELGAGSSLKARLLLDCLDRPGELLARRHLGRVPRATSRGRRRRRLPDVTVHPVLADFTRPFALPVSRSTRGAHARVLPGLDDRQPVARSCGGAARQSLAERMPGGALLIGVDICKDAAVLHARLQRQPRRHRSVQPEPARHG